MEYQYHATASLVQRVRPRLHVRIPRDCGRDYGRDCARDCAHDYAHQVSSLPLFPV